MKKVLRAFLWVLISLVLLVGIAVAAMYRADIPLETLAEEYATDTSFYVDVQIVPLEGEPFTVNVHAMEEGEETAPAVVLIHGMFSSSHTFLPWSERLVEEGYRVVLIDLPGFGLSETYSDGKTSQRRHSTVVKAVLDSLSIAEAFVGGNSMGGGVSWYFASESHENDFTVLGVILIDAVYPGMIQESGDEGIQSLLASPVGRFLAHLTPRFLFASALKGAYGSSEPSEIDIDRYYALLRGEGHREAIVSQEIEAEPDGSLSGMERLLTLKENGIPVLVMWGKWDSWIPVETAALFADSLDLSETSIVIFDSLGHVPMEEDPESTFPTLLDFLILVEGD